MADAAGGVVAEEHLLGVVDRVDFVHQHEVPLPFGEHDELRPLRARFAAGRGVLVFVGRLHRQVIFPADHLRLHRLHPVAKLRPFHAPLAVAAAVGDQVIVAAAGVGLVGVPGIAADPVPIRGNHLLAPGLVAPRLHQPVNHHQAIPRLPKAGRLVEKRLLLDAGHPLLGVVFGNDRFELIGFDFDGPVVFGDFHPV